MEYFEFRHDLNIATFFLDAAGVNTNNEISTFHLQGSEDVTESFARFIYVLDLKFSSSCVGVFNGEDSYGLGVILDLSKVESE